jgi:UDP-N-acetylmuramoylalanine--D-glutamate ligase
MKRRHTAIVGLGITGYSCLRYLHGRDDLLILDTREAPPFLDAVRNEFPELPVRCGVREHDFDAVDRIIVSPGMSLDSCLLSKVRGRVPLLSDIDLFCEAAQAPILAITGTNGKSTVTALVGHLLACGGVRAPVGGNLGEAALDILDDDAEAYVLELSSFQLERLAPHRFAAATILNLTEDHLDRHGDMVSYRASKQRIYRRCDLAVCNRADPATRPEAAVARLTSFGPDVPEPGHWGVRELGGERMLARGDEPVLACAQLPLAGRHNEQNALAACALLEDFSLAAPALADGLRTFRGLRHRCELVAEIDGVRFVNDSKATNVGATVAALAGFAGEGVVLIAGGDGKGADFSPLGEAVRGSVREVVTLGRDGKRLGAALAAAVPVTHVASMAEAVRTAAAAARPGDVVLLSPACASLDSYTNFAARGDDFAACVRSLHS